MINFNQDQCYVWIWLPGAVQPIVAGKLEVNDHHHDFFYGQSYLNNPQAIALSKTEMPLARGVRYTSKYQIHSVIRDSLPDAWGQRILHHRYQRASLSPIDMLLTSSSDRIGALHFQQSAKGYVPRFENHATLDQLINAVNHIEQGKPLSKTLNEALVHGTSIGGARPKALIENSNRKYIAKFSSITDVFPIVQAEFATMSMAKQVGINVADVKLINTAGKFVLLVERFDREHANNGWTRKFIVSGLTLLGLDEIEARYASYLDLADQIRKRCKNPISDLKELFRRMVFNILVGNTDDHAKNHAFFYDGNQFELCPAYDICPYPRSGLQATQAMTIGQLGSFSLLKNALSAAASFQLSEQQAQNEIDRLVELVKNLWPTVSKAAQLTPSQSAQLKDTAILNPYCFYDVP